ncbi:thioesterase domain-containing protein [Roseovarius sp. C7]|uniref:thioesterase domain-containing protein n=1 Tax=Roseovarius sp. C7 TaxID=3398643 RepID=UPI0039F70AB9
MESVAGPAQDDATGYRHLVPLHSGTPGSGAPLFIVAGMFGNVMNLRHIAGLLGKDRPVFGLQARGLVGDEPPHERIEDAARDYIAEMRQHQPDGPYMLAGFSGGGITAYEIARQLSADGQGVGSLILLDTPLPVRPSLTSLDKILIKLHEMRRKGPGYLVEWARNRVAWQAEKRRRAEQREAVSEVGRFDNAGIERAFLTAVAAYETKPWDGPVTLFRPRLDRHWAVSGGNFVSREREYVFEDNQWRPLAPKLEVIEVPGDHDSMVLMPNVSVLARHMGDELRAADGRGPGGVTFLWPNQTAAE